MAEYIDRQELIDAGRAIKLKDICPDWNVPIVAKALEQQGQAFLELIKKAPTADVVEVVRCKDCQKWDTSKKFINSCACSYWSPSKKDCRFTLPDDFCSNGVKKEGAENENA